MKIALVIGLLACLLAVAGCGLLPQKQITDEQGNKVYIDTEGKGTIQATDPASGKPNKPAMEYDIGKVENIVTGAKDATGWIPAPFSDWAIALLGLGGTALAAFLKRENAKKREAIGIGTNLVESIEQTPAAHKIAAEALSVLHTKETKAFVADVTAPASA